MEFISRLGDMQRRQNAETERLQVTVPLRSPPELH